MNRLKVVFRAIRALISGEFKGHFSQYGEDIILRKLFPKNYSGQYVEIGAYHPFRFSNTAGFWIRGWRGVNVDANPATIRRLNKNRPGDKNICVAIVPDESIQSIRLYLPSAGKGDMDYDGEVSAIGTCDERTAIERGFHVSDGIDVPAMTINALLEKYCGDMQKIDYINIDIEGLDEEVILSMDLDRWQPSLISVEAYERDLRDLVNTAIYRKLTNEGYIGIARLGPTVIFSSLKNPPPAMRPDWKK